MSLGLNTHNSVASVSPSEGQKMPFYPSPPLTGYETSANYDSSALVAAQARASRKGVALTTCLTITLILTSLLAMNAVLLAYLCAVHQCQLSSHSIVSTAPLGKVLTITQITTHIAPLSIPIIMGLFSYLLSAEWIRSSINGGPNRPTPMQLGLLLSLCNGANIGSFFSSLKYVALNQLADKARTTSPAPILRQSVMVLGSLLAISYIATGADSWLHASSTSVIIPSNSSYKSSAIPNFGREINATMCQLAKASYDSGDTAPVVASSCGIIGTGSAGTGMTLGEGLRVVSNFSTLHRVAFTEDQTAILVPQNLPSNVTYVAQTLGVKSQCTTVTKECIFKESVLGYGPEANLNLDCVKAGIQYGNATGVSPLCPLDSQGFCTDGADISSNPFTTGEVAISFAYLTGTPDQPTDTFIGNTGWFIHGNNGAWNVVFCHVTAVDVTYAYSSSRFLLQNATPKPLDEARAMMSAGLMEPTSIVSQAVNGAGMNAGTTYEQAYSIELSRQMLARGAFIYEPRNVISIQSENNIVGSSLRLIPLVLVVSASLVFACQIIWITVKVAIATRNVQFVGLAAVHIKNPLAMVQSLYGRHNPVLTWEMNTVKRFGTETELDRLHVGPVIIDDRILSSAFMVTKG